MGYASLEWVGGLSHSQAKMAHLAMHTLALICGWLGFASKYEGSENGGVAHFRSVHSLIGILVLVCWLPCSSSACQPYWKRAIPLPRLVAESQAS
jgi:hypothetical protein